MAAIFERISKVASEIGAIAKGSKNAQQGWSYRGIDDIMNSIAPILYNNKVFLAPFVTDIKREEREGKSGGILTYTTLTVEYTVYTDDGSSVKICTIGEAMDSGDKSANKAMSAAYKYAILELFCIPTAELDKDPDSQAHEVKKKTDTATIIKEQFTDDGFKVQAYNALKDKIGVDAITELNLSYGVERFSQLTPGKIRQILAENKINI